MQMSFTLPFTTSEWHNGSKTKSASAALICMDSGYSLKCPADTLLLRHDQRIFWNCTDGGLCCRIGRSLHSNIKCVPKACSHCPLEWARKNRGLEVPKLFRALWASAVQFTSPIHVACSVDIAWGRLALFSLNKLICANTERWATDLVEEHKKRLKFKACRTRIMRDSKNWSLNSKDSIMSERLVLSCCVWNNTHVLRVSHQRSMIKFFISNNPPLDKAPRPSISNAIWVLSSDTTSQLNQLFLNSDAAMLSTLDLKLKEMILWL